jgi:hypothetical protein
LSRTLSSLLFFVAKITLANNFLAFLVFSVVLVPGVVVTAVVVAVVVVTVFVVAVLLSVKENKVKRTLRYRKPFF